NTDDIPVSTTNFKTILSPEPLMAPLAPNVFAQYYIFGTYNISTSCMFQLQIGSDKSPPIGPFELPITPSSGQMWTMWTALVITCDGKMAELSIEVWTDDNAKVITLEFPLTNQICDSIMTQYDVLMLNLNPQTDMNVIMEKILVCDSELMGHNMISM